MLGPCNRMGALMLSLAPVADPSGYGDQDLFNTLRHVSGFLRANTSGADPGFVGPFHVRLTDALRRLAPAIGVHLFDDADVDAEHMNALVAQRLSAKDGAGLARAAVEQFVREGIAIAREAGHIHRSGLRASGNVAHLFRADGGVPKTAVDEVNVAIRGIVGDGQAHRQHHGRPFQALSLFSVELVDELRREGHPITPGGVGENISTRGLDWDALQPGVQLRVGTVVAEVSCFADPCSQIAHNFTRRDFNRIDEERIPGSGRRYAWVLEPGEIRVGDAIVVGSSAAAGSPSASESATVQGSAVAFGASTEAARP